MYGVSFSSIRAISFGHFYIIPWPFIIHWKMNTFKASVMSSTKTQKTEYGTWHYSGHNCYKTCYYYYSYDFGGFKVIERKNRVYKYVGKWILCKRYQGDFFGNFHDYSEPATKSG